MKIGEKINNWEVISDKCYRKYGRYYINVRCTCGSSKEFFIPKNSKIFEKYKGCDKCSRGIRYTGIGSLSGDFWSLIKHGAKCREITFTLTIEEAWNKYIEQEGKCNLTGISIFFEPDYICSKSRNNRDEHIRTASLDRIDSSLGYTIDNIQWIHKDVNIMKNKFSESYFKQICKLVCQNN